MRTDPFLKLPIVPRKLLRIQVLYLTPGSDYSFLERWKGIFVVKTLAIFT